MSSSIDRKSLLNSEWDCSCGQNHKVPVRLVAIESGALSRLPNILKDETKGGKTLLISDLITHKIIGEKAARLLTENGIHTRELVVPQEKPSADDKTADWVLSEVCDEAVLVACGSGTINDLTKYAAFKKGRPFIAVATAPSMNGYASGIVALTENGLKKTIVAAPPIAVIADLDILCDAPIEMIRSGLGDVISKPVSIADWKLDSIVKGTRFCSVPYELIADLESIYTKHPEQLSHRDIGAIRALTEALVYSGISMVIAGSSAPASGGEHLISHTLDMQASLKGGNHDFHGAQVGVATIVTAKLYEEIMMLDPDDLDWTKIWENHKAGKAKKIRQYWGPLATHVMPEYEKKWMPWSQKKEELSAIVEKWDDFTSAIRPFLKSSSEIKRILTGAGAKAHYMSIGASGEVFKKAILMAMTMRSRYTILDLADDLNLLEEFANRVVL
jgi:glycerol-1-phosphate dehydrogenase [NAD(P)+]